jgi:transcriptional regulator with PAS, ATPase and Fis domain
VLCEPEKDIGPELLSDNIRQRHRSLPFSDADLKTAVRVLEEDMIRETLTRLGQNKSRTARALGISRQSLLEKLRRMGVSE